MAKRKQRAAPRKKTTRRRTTKRALSKSSNTMATRRKRRRRSGTSSVRRSLSAAARKSGRPRRRRRKRGLSAALSMSNLTNHAKHNGAGALGGALFTGTRLISMPTYMRGAAGFAGSMLLSMANFPFVGAGMAGATAYYLAQNFAPAGMLHDEYELEDTDYVDADTLSATGMTDEYGNDLVMGDDGMVYALNDSGELEAIGEGSDLQSVSGVPLYDGNPYDLNDAYQLSMNY